MTTEKPPTPRQTLSNESIEKMKHDFIYGVGYKKPPIENQFQKGQSGNPKGRPRNRDATNLAEQTFLDELILEEAKKLITVREGNEQHEMTAIHAILKSLKNKALKGDVHAQKYLLSLVEKSEGKKFNTISEINEFWREYKKHWRQKIEQAQANSTAIEVPLPHPSDIVIETGKEPRFIGPVCTEELEAIQHIITLREVLFAQASYEERTITYPNIDPNFEGVSTASVLAIMLNDNLPVRFQLNDSKIIDIQISYQQMTKRELLKLLRQSWRSLGLKPKRGFCLPRLDSMMKVLTASINLVEPVVSGKLPTKNLHISDKNEHVQNYLTARENQPLDLIFP